MKHLILIQIKGKLKSFGCSVDAGKLVFDFRNNKTMFFDDKENVIKEQKSIEPQVKKVFLQLIEKKANKKVDVLIMAFDFKKKTLSLEVFYEDKTTDKKEM